MENAGKVHHFTEVINFITLHQIINIIRINSGACSFESSCGYTTRSTEVKFKWDRVPVVYHKLNSFQSADIRYFMWVAYRCHSTMNNGKLCKFRWHQHRAFDVNV